MTGALHPYCQTCGWRKGGADSWPSNGRGACKCGHWEPPMPPTATVHPSDVDQPLNLRCQHCKDVFERPFDEFFYRDKNGPHGWRRWCKACYSEAPSIRARTHQERAS